MFRAVISRKNRQLVTTGCLLCFNDDQVILSIKSLELPWKNNQKGVSCIPQNTYLCKKVKSPSKNKKIGGWVYLLMDVPGRSAVEIHIGNFASGIKVDTEGCILVGMRHTDINLDGIVDIAESTEAMKAMLAVMPDEFYLTIF